MKTAGAQVAAMRMQKVDAYYVDDKRPAQSDFMNSDQPSLAPVAAPARVRWREFRIQKLPLLAFGGALFLAGLLWHKTVIPISLEPKPDSSLTAQDPTEAVPGLGNSLIHQAARQETNGIVKAPPD